MDNINSNSEKVLIFATFHKTIDIIGMALHERYGITPGKIDGRTPNEERQTLIDDFSKSEGFDVLILHPRTAGMGLNITLLQTMEPCIRRTSYSKSMAKWARKYCYRLLFILC
jgi:SNF2 family DNA or RNA helicase